MVTRKVGQVVVASALVLTTACSKSSSDSSADDSSSVAASPAPGSISAGAGTTTGTTTSVGGQASADPAAAAAVTSYKPTNTPTKVAPAIPGTLTIEGTKLRLLSAGADTSNAADATKPEGYIRLHEKMTEVTPLLADLTLKLYLFDSVLAGHQAACAALPCSIPNVTAVPTKDMAAAVIEAIGGKTSLSAAKRAEIEALVGQPQDLGTLQIAAAPTGSTYEQCVTIVESAAESTIYCYSKTNLSVDYRYREETEGEDGAQKQVSEGSYSLTYDVVKDVLVLIDEEIKDKTRSRDSFTIQADTKSTKKNAVIATFDLSGVEPAYGTWGSKMSVIADDEGGVVDTDYYWEEQTIDAFETANQTLTGDGTQYYLMLPSATTASTAFDSVGYVEGKGAYDTTNYIYYYGPRVVPATLKLFTISYDADGNEVLTDSALTATLAVSNTQNHFYYLEEFGASGALSYTCSKSVKVLTECDYADGTPGAYVQALQGETFAFGDAFLQVALTGPGANSAAMGAETFYIVPASFDLGAESPQTIGYIFPEALAWGVFGGDPEQPSATGLSDYRLEIFASSPEEFADVKVWKVAYKTGAGEEGTPYFAPVDATVTATN